MNERGESFVSSVGHVEVPRRKTKSVGHQNAIDRLCCISEMRYEVEGSGLGQFAEKRRIKRTYFVVIYFEAEEEAEHERT